MEEEMSLTFTDLNFKKKMEGEMSDGVNITKLTIRSACQAHAM